MVSDLRFEAGNGVEEVDVWSSGRLDWWIRHRDIGGSVWRLREIAG